MSYICSKGGEPWQQEMIKYWYFLSIFWLNFCIFTGPRSRPTHWKQTVMYLEDVITICEGEALTGIMSVSQNKKNPRDLDVTVQYSFNGKRSSASRTQHYRMRWTQAEFIMELKKRTK
jgi:hypothetical protein